LVELTWDDNGDDNDQDLHLTDLSVSQDLCGSDDCFWDNKEPRWYTSSPAGSGPNPSLDIDDQDGAGPENINIDTPHASTYRIYVHYFLGFEPTINTVKIWVDGELAKTYTRTLEPDDVWAVAEIDWASAGVATITAYPSDSPGKIGTVEYMDNGCWGEWSWPD
jgi:hypothetical protein